MVAQTPAQETKDLIDLVRDQHQQAITSSLAGQIAPEAGSLNDHERIAQCLASLEAHMNQGPVPDSTANLRLFQTLETLNVSTIRALSSSGQPIPIQNIGQDNPPAGYYVCLHEHPLNDGNDALVFMREDVGFEPDIQAQFLHEFAPVPDDRVVFKQDIAKLMPFPAKGVMQGLSFDPVKFGETVLDRNKAWPAIRLNDQQQIVTADPPNDYRDRVALESQGNPPAIPLDADFNAALAPALAAAESDPHSIDLSFVSPAMPSPTHEDHSFDDQYDPYDNEYGLDDGSYGNQDNTPNDLNDVDPNQYDDDLGDTFDSSQAGSISNDSIALVQQSSGLIQPPIVTKASDIEKHSSVSDFVKNALETNDPCVSVVTGSDGQSYKVICLDQPDGIDIDVYDEQNRWIVNSVAAPNLLVEDSLQDNIHAIPAILAARAVAYQIYTLRGTEPNPVQEASRRNVLQNVEASLAESNVPASTNSQPSHSPATPPLDFGEISFDDLFGEDLSSQNFDASLAQQMSSSNSDLDTNYPDDIEPIDVPEDQAKPTNEAGKPAKSAASSKKDDKDDAELMAGHPQSSANRSSATQIPPGLRMGNGGQAGGGYGGGGGYNQYIPPPKSGELLFRGGAWAVRQLFNPFLGAKSQLDSYKNASQDTSVPSNAAGQDQMSYADMHGMDMQTALEHAHAKRQKTLSVLIEDLKKTGNHSTLIANLEGFDKKADGVKKAIQQIENIIEKKGYKKEAVNALIKTGETASLSMDKKSFYQVLTKPENKAILKNLQNNLYKDSDFLKARPSPHELDKLEHEQKVISERLTIAVDKDPNIQIEAAKNIGDFFNSHFDDIKALSENTAPISLDKDPCIEFSDEGGELQNIAEEKSNESNQLMKKVSDIISQIFKKRATASQQNDQTAENETRNDFTP